LPTRTLLVARRSAGALAARDFVKRTVGPPMIETWTTMRNTSAVVFYLDIHVYCIARQIGLVPADADREAVRKYLKRDVPPGRCGFGHTAIIRFGRERVETAGVAAVKRDV
jgi:endonuclease-3